MILEDKVLRIREIMQFYKLNQTEFAKITRIHKTSVSKILNGEIPCGEGVTNKILLAFPNICQQWLITGQGQMLSKEPQQSGVVQNNFSGNNNYVLGGSVNTLGATGTSCPECGAELIEVEEVRKPIIPTEWTYQPNVDIYEKVQRDSHAVSRSRFIALDVPIDMWHIVRDDSLLPDAKRGDLIALSAYPIGYENPIPGKLHAIDTKSNGILIRKLFFEDYGFRGLAPNPEFPDIRILHEDIIRVYRIVCLARIAL